MKITLDKTKNKIYYYTFLLTSHSILLYLIVMIIYSLLFIYFFADPILCQGDETMDELFGNNLEDNTSEVEETFPLSALAEEARAEGVQESIRDPEISERLKYLRTLSQNYAQQVNEKLNTLNTFYNNDMDKLVSASQKYEY
jgi:hypothetical protein